MKAESAVNLLTERVIGVSLDSIHWNLNSECVSVQVVVVGITCGYPNVVKGNLYFQLLQAILL